MPDTSWIPSCERLGMKRLEFCLQVNISSFRTNVMLFAEKLPSLDCSRFPTATTKHSPYFSLRESFRIVLYCGVLYQRMMKYVHFLFDEQYYSGFR
jgi:hypothetical protein